MHLCDYWDELTENKIRQDEPSFAVFCFQSRKLKMKKPYENGKNTLIGIKLPSSRATYPNLLNIKMNHNSQTQLFIFKYAK